MPEILRLHSLENQVDRILKMFNATSLDDILSATPIQNERPPSGPRPAEPEGTIKVPSGYHPSVGAVAGQAELDRENMRVRDLEGGMEGKVNRLQRDAAELERAREMQEVLAKMLRVQLDKVDKIKELIEEYKAKEISLMQSVKGESEGIEEAKGNVLKHLDTLRLLANNVRDQEMERLNKYTNPILPQVLANYPESDRPPITAQANYLDKPNMEIGEYPRLFDKMTKINSMKKINSIKKIKSMTGLTNEQAKRLLGWQKERDNTREPGTPS